MNAAPALPLGQSCLLPRCPVEPIILGNLYLRRQALSCCFPPENQECLEIPGNGKTDFVPVQQSACSVSANQRWSLVPVSGE